MLPGISNDWIDQLLCYIGPRGSAYEDICVIDMLDSDPIDCPGLKRLLTHIEETWIKEVGPLEELDKSQCGTFSLKLWFNNFLTNFIEPSAEVCPRGCNWVERYYIHQLSHFLQGHWYNLIKILLVLIQAPNQMLVMICLKIITGTMAFTNHLGLEQQLWKT